MWDEVCDNFGDVYDQVNSRSEGTIVLSVKLFLELQKISCEYRNKMKLQYR